MQKGTGYYIHSSQSELVNGRPVVSCFTDARKNDTANFKFAVTEREPEVFYAVLL